LTAYPPLVEALLRPEAYPHRPRRIRLVETHISYVFLAGPYAYKVKKPVNFGFLDYSTLEKRRHFCEEEVRLNRELCPDTHLGVIPITRSAHGFAVGGGGEVVEYAVLMRRLPENRMLDRLVRRGRVEAEVLVRLARRVAAFHAASARGPEIDRFGSPEMVRFNWEENFAQTAPYVGRTLPRRWYEGIRRYVGDFLRNSAELLLKRLAEGRIRDCHGDLRAESVCVEDGICVFDRIEFNDRFRYGDVASEVAFLTMDLDALGRPDLGYVFAEAYIAASGDLELRRLLPFYQCYRAYVRGKVTGFRLDQVGTEREGLKVRRLARRYFRLAWDYARAPQRPVVLALTGTPPDAGLFLARGLGCRLGGSVRQPTEAESISRDLQAGIPVVIPARELPSDLAGQLRAVPAETVVFDCRGMTRGPGREPPGRVLNRLLKEVRARLDRAG